MFDVGLEAVYMIWGRKTQLTERVTLDFLSVGARLGNGSRSLLSREALGWCGQTSQNIDHGGC